MHSGFPPKVTKTLNELSPLEYVKMNFSREMLKQSYLTIFKGVLLKFKMS